MYANYNQRFLKDNSGLCGRSFVVQQKGFEQLHYERMIKQPAKLDGFVQAGGKLGNAPRGHSTREFEVIEKELRRF